MPSTLASRRLPQVRKGRRYSAEEVHAECVAAVDASGLTQVQIAELIDKSPGTVSRAMTDATGRYAGTQALILSKLNGWRIEKHDPPPYWKRSG